MSVFKPMLSGKADLATLRFDCLASPKIDGVRLLVMNGVAVSRTLKPIPNQFVQRMLGQPQFEGLDGEIVVGPMNAPDVYLKTNSAVMSVQGNCNFSYVVFDRWNKPDLPFHERLPQQEFITDRFQVVPLQHTRIHSLEELLAYQEQVLVQGYEGVMLRSPDAPYKHGRSTTREGYLLKLKNYDSAEAVVIGVEEEMRNDNPATLDARGHTSRSTHQANKTGKGTVGALAVRGVNGPYAGVVFNIGSGFTAAQRAEEWALGTVVEYKFFPHGAKDRPRHPVLLRRRNGIDVEESRNARWRATA